MFGNRHGSAAFARYPSVKRMTGVMCRTAMRTASIATSKQSLGLRAAITGTGASALRPYTAWYRSDCSVFVGKPVDGPPRCELTTTSGSSALMARPIASVFNAMPGPELDVTPMAPPYDAPIAAHTAAISSSAWNVPTPILP